MRGYLSSRPSGRRLREPGSINTGRSMIAPAVAMGPGSRSRSPGTTAVWELELHLRRLVELGARLAEIEEGLRMEAERAGDQCCGELLDAGVVFLHRVVEEATRGRELVLDVRDLALQLHEVLVGL